MVDQNTCWRYESTGEAAGPVTRHSHMYGRVAVETREADPCWRPISVQENQNMSVVTRLAGGPILAPTGQSEVNTFWVYLRSLKGAWMWDHIYNPGGLEGVHEALREGTAVLVTDGSYNWKVRADMDAAGWLLFCRRRRKILLKCSFYEVCNNAGSYRGELLGLASLHVFLYAMEQYYGFQVPSKCIIACDNLGALNKSKQKRKKVPSGAKHADILRVLRTVHHIGCRAAALTGMFMDTKTRGNAGSR